MFSKYTLKELIVGSGTIVGKGNIADFFDYVAKQEDVEHKSIAELAPDYDTAIASLVRMLEARFIGLNPFMQHMFFTLHDVKDVEKRDFILKTLLHEFNDVAVEIRKVFDRFGKLGSCVEIVDILKKLDTTMPRDFKVPIPFKLVAINDAYEYNFGWVVPENVFDEGSKPKRKEIGTSKTHLERIPCMVEGSLSDDFASLSLDNT